ncbi:hypothetical protein DFS34DRAFT_668498 [Phlyctochytrium arcticum]|nr:hypothetical protein DFS34DRAFT_668498 [Phlyctochytrium arcticum]
MEELRRMRAMEVAEGRFSPGFKIPLPYSRSSPMALVPKPNSPDKLRLITNQSYPPEESVNDTILADERKVKYNMVQDLARRLRVLEKRGVLKEVQALWKADIQGAFRLLPGHPLWMLWQIVEIDGELHVDQRVVFCGGTSPRIWYFIPRVIQGQPPALERFLEACAALGFPVAKEKTAWGSALEITGIVVDLLAGQLRFSHQRSDRLATELETWKNSPRRQMHDLCQLIGWLNFFLTVAPICRPFLAPLYAKLGAWTADYRMIHIGLEQKQVFAFLQHVVQEQLGTYYLSATTWGPQSADYEFYVDASTSWGAGLWFPPLQLGVATDLQHADAFKDWTIFPLEMLAIWTALL